MPKKTNKTEEITPDAFNAEQERRHEEMMKVLKEILKELVTANEIANNEEPPGMRG